MHARFAPRRQSASEPNHRRLESGWKRTATEHRV